MRELYGALTLIRQRMDSGLPCLTTQPLTEDSSSSELQLPFIQEGISRCVVPRDGGRGAERELDESGQKIQTSSYKINKDQGCKVQHDDCSYGIFESC